MTVASILLKSTKEYILANLPAGITEHEVAILPERKVPASMGQQFITIHTSSIRGITPDASTRKRSIDFGVSMSKRVRDFPNDRFGELAYLDNLSMSNIIEYIISLIESEAFTQAFAQSLSEVPSGVEGLPRFSITDNVKFLSANLDPHHLYPSDFLTRKIDTKDKDQIYEKVAGFQMTANFESPSYVENISPVQCRGLDGEGGSSSS